MKAKPNGLREETTAAILDAVERLLIRSSYRAMSLEAVANESGVGIKALSLGFRNKGDLLLAREDRVANSVRQTLQRIARRSGSWENKLREMLYLRVLLRFDSVQHFPESVDDILADIGPDLREREVSFCVEESKIVTTVLQRARRISLLPRDAVSELANSLLVATNAFLPFHLTRSNLQRRSIFEARIRRVIDLLLSGLPAKVAC